MSQFGYGVPEKAASSFSSLIGQVKSSIVKVWGALGAEPELVDCDKTEEMLDVIELETDVGDVVVEVVVD